jgi:eukaryotic-like serine/threonine-protein kinase
MEVRLEVIKGPDRGKLFVLNEATSCVAGRSQDARFRFSEEDPYISRRHFLLEVAPPKVYFRDLDVTNPSKINELYVEETELADGDIIEVGYTLLRVSLKMDLPSETLHCRQCGRSFDIFGDESPGQVCANCLKDLQEKRDREAAALLKEPHPVRCQCGKDLTAKANSDGRVHELMGKVTYACDKCVSKIRVGQGKKIEGYEALRLIGQGGMGVVYLAHQASTARLVALKEMNLFNEGLAARFAREIRIIKQVSHENVLFYIDSGQDKNSARPYLVMEYAPGGCAEDLLKGHRTLPAGEVVSLIIQSLRGLQCIHDAGIVHRDIKPENILLKQENGKGPMVPKIADFGLAREFSKVGGSILTKLGSALGTVLFMPPEQIRDAHTVREPADLYSTGVTLYYLLTGKYPFNFPTPFDILKFFNEHKHTAASPDHALRMMIEAMKLKTPHLIVLSEDPIPIRERMPQIPVELARIVDKAIRKDISRRYRTARDFSAELEGVIGRL